jgi:hypothetical protein
MPTFRHSATLAALTICAMTAACSAENPAAPAASSGRRLDGGVTFGSGGRTDINTSTAADSGSTATRGGVTLGSGS